MFDWNEGEEVRGKSLGELNETEDHVVPYPIRSEDDTLFEVDEYHKKQKYEQTSTNLRATERRKLESKNNHPGSNSESISNFNWHEELFAPRFEMDPWPDLPSLNSAFGKGYMNRNHLHSMSSKFIRSSSASPDVDTVTENLVAGLCDADDVIENGDLSLESCSLPASDLIQLDTELGIFGNDHGDEEGGSFLNCDWGNIADFDDLDRIFRNDDSIFGHEMIGDADELLSPPAEVISAITMPFPMPVDEQSGGERKPLEEDKMADNIAAISGQVGCHSQPINVNCKIHDRISDKADREKKLSKSRRKLVEKTKTKHSQNFSSWHSNMGGIQQFERMKMQTPCESPKSFQSATFSQQMEGGGPTHIGYFHCANQKLLPEYRYPARAFPIMPTPSPAHPERKEKHPISQSHIVYPDSSKNTSEVQSKPLTMTPQEKIEKLRRRQQIQAMLAIQQQQQQFHQKSTPVEMSVSQTSSQMNRSHGAAISGKVDEDMKAMTSSELHVPQEMDETNTISILIDDKLRETIFYHLQDAIRKLDIGIRLSIRDSLFRLARSAMERHNANDGSSTNKISQNEAAVLVNEETNIHDRSTRLPSETGTNPIDRTVAHLLFHRPSEPVSQWSNTGESLSGDKPGDADADKLDVNPSM